MVWKYRYVLISGMCNAFCHGPSSKVHLYLPVWCGNTVIITWKKLWDKTGKSLPQKKEIRKLKGLKTLSSNSSMAYENCNKTKCKLAN